MAPYNCSPNQVNVKDTLAKIAVVFKTQLDRPSALAQVSKGKTKDKY